MHCSPTTSDFPLNPVVVVTTESATCHCQHAESQLQKFRLLFCIYMTPSVGLPYYYMSFWSEFYALSEYLSYNVHILIFILPAMCQCWHSLSWHVETILFLTVLTKTYGIVEAMVSMLSHTVTQCDKLDIGGVCELYWIIDIMYIYINDEGIASQPSDSPTRWQPTRRQVTRRL